MKDSVRSGSLKPQEARGSTSTKTLPNGFMAA